MMKSNLIVALALIGFVASSACSRSNGGGSPPPIEQTAPPVAPPNSQSELDNDSSKSAQDSRTAPGPQESADVDPTAPSRTAPGERTAPKDRRSAPGHARRSAPRTDGPEEIPYNPTGLTPDQIFDTTSRQSPVVVGGESDVPNGQSDQPLYYSGAGQDDLREQLQSWVNTKTPEKFARGNREFSKRVLDGRFDVDWTTRQATIDVTIKGLKGPKVYRFQGILSNRLTFEAGDVNTGARVKVKVACMDLNGGCNTVYAMILDGNGALSRTAHVIIRQTEATLFTHAAGFGLANNPEFDALLETMVRTDHHAGELNALNSLKLRTSETINGQASFRVEMGIRSAYNQQETLNLGGPLVKPSGDYVLDAQAQVLRSTSPSANTIRAVMLTRNDGRGNLTLSVTVRKAFATAQEDTMDLTFSRIHKPVRPLVIK